MKWIKGEKVRVIKDEKFKPSLVYPSLIKAVARVKEYGNKKYGSQENWTTYSDDDLYNAMMRHVLEINKDYYKRDNESKQLHLAHIACNTMLLLERYIRGEMKNEK